MDGLNSEADGDDNIDPKSWRGSAGWERYFGRRRDVDPTLLEKEQGFVDRLYEFFRGDGWRFVSMLGEDSLSFALDFAEFVGAVPQQGIGPAILESPEEAFACIGLAAARALEYNLVFMERTPESPIDLLWPRFRDIPTKTAMKDLNSSSIGKLVSIQGNVVRASNVRQQVYAMGFKCVSCGKDFERNFQDFKYTVPTSCDNAPKCKGRSFRPMLETAACSDWQKVRIQEHIQDDVREVGRMPRTVDAELVSDLIESCIPGDTIIVCGVVKVLTVDDQDGKKSSNKGASRSLYHMYLDANSVVAAQGVRGRNARLAADAFTDEDHEAFEEIAKDRDPFALLVHSLCPTIVGHEMVKAGILLSLLGGNQKNRDHENLSVRPDIHCLVVGDPGMGKSQMLKAATNVAPRGVYICGNTSTTAGLTVTLAKEQGSNDFALEAGALVLGDHGVCCIDEFDKMGNEHQALLEAMEQQTVSIAKGGIICNLSAKTSVIAAANPRSGHYDMSKTVCENLKIALPLLSRFDLVFILLDRPDEARDRVISKHVLRPYAAARKADSLPESSQRGEPTDRDEQHRTPLKTRLREYRCRDPIPPTILRKFVAYARSNTHPVLSRDAKQVLKNFYLALRKGVSKQTLDVTPVTTRQLESLIRLVEARAKAQHRLVGTEQDALDVVELMKASMIDTFSDEHGFIDLSRASGTSRSGDAKRFFRALQSEARRRNRDFFTTAELKRIAQRIGVNGPSAQELIDVVNQQGLILKRPGGYQLQGLTLSGD